MQKTKKKAIISCFHWCLNIYGHVFRLFVDVHIFYVELFLNICFEIELKLRFGNVTAVAAMHYHIEVIKRKKCNIRTCTEVWKTETQN